MSTVIRNLAEFQMAMQFRVGEALDNTMQRLLEHLQYLVMEDVYAWESTAYMPWGMIAGGTAGLTTGNRTGQFYESWEKVMPIMVGNMMVGEINQALDVMKQFLLGGQIVHQDGANLAEIINSGSGYNFGECEEPRPFWNNFLIFVTENLEKIFLEECIKVGLPIQRVGVI
jgi:hypothetical protein